MNDVWDIRDRAPVILPQAPVEDQASYELAVMTMRPHLRERFLRSMETVDAIRSIMEHGKAMGVI